MTDDLKTPIGPWEYFPAQNYEGFAIAPAGRLPTLAAVESKGCITVFNYPKSTEAHARLIAAAPELLALAKKMLAAWEGSGPGIVLDDIRALIAKAEGRK